MKKTFRKLFNKTLHPFTEKIRERQKRCIFGTTKFFYNLFARTKTEVNHFEFDDFDVKFKDNVMELPPPQMRRLNPTYAMVKPLEFHPIIKINKMQHFKSMLRWRELNLNQSVVFRNYPLGFTAKIRSFDKPRLALKLPPKVLKIDRKDLNIARKITINEEIVRILPYIRKLPRKSLLRIPLIKQPLHKYMFSREEMKLMREKLAQQHNTSWVKIKIFEIYDKFNANSYKNVRQIPGSKDLECTLSPDAFNQNPKKNYYLVIGQQLDTGGHIKAIIDSADIKIEKND